MTLSPKVVNFVGLDFLYYPYEIGRVGKVAIMQAEVNIGLVRILVYMIDPFRIE
jgi:hypothetical protein